MKGLKFVTLDVTNTLLKIKGGVGSAYRIVGAQYGLFADQTDEMIEKHFRSVYKHYWTRYHNYGNEPKQAADWWSLVTTDTAITVSREGGVTLESDLLAEFSDSIYKHFSTGEAYEVIPGVKRTLTSMKSAGIRMGVITNNDSRIHGILHELLGSHLFQFVLVSNEEGSAKPDKHLFLKASELAKEDLAEMLHVGDSYTKDYLPAHTLGMNAVLVSRTPCPHDCVRIDKFDELTGLLGLR